MRHYTLTVSILALLFGSCTEAAKLDGGALSSPDLTSASRNAAQQDVPDQFRRNIVTEMAFSDTFYMESLPLSYMESLPLSERFQDLDPREISQAEIDELIVLENQQKESIPAFRIEQQAWAQQDPARRGPEPVYKAIPQAERLQALWYKAGLAEIRKKYGNFDSRVLSKADSEEIIALEQKLVKIAFEDQNRLTAWYKLDSATRGPRPGRPQAMLENNNPRLKELRDKFKVAQKVEHEIERIGQLSQTHNISILDNERTELIQLHTEQQKFQDDMNKVLTGVLISKGGQINAEALNKGQLTGELIEKLPKDTLRRMSETSERIDEIQSPFEAAEKADKIREQMIKLSETSGFAISSDEIAETIALNAEKDKIQKRTQLEAGRKCMAEGGPVVAVQKPLPNAVDEARLKAIEDRLKAISPSFD